MPSLTEQMNKMSLEEKAQPRRRRTRRYAQSWGPLQHIIGTTTAVGRYVTDGKVKELKSDIEVHSWRQIKADKHATAEPFIYPDDEDNPGPAVNGPIYF